MPKEAVFTLKLEPELRAAFMAEAEAAHRPASQVVRELMREFGERQRQAREYEAFLHLKVDSASQGRASFFRTKTTAWSMNLPRTQCGCWPWRTLRVCGRLLGALITLLAPGRCTEARPGRTGFVAG